MASRKIAGGAATPVIFLGSAIANNPPIITDNFLPVVDITALEVARSNGFFASAFDLTVADSATFSLLIVTPANRNIFLIAAVAGTGNATFTITEGVTIDTPGGAVTGINLNRQTKEAPQSTFQVDASVSSGTLLYSEFIPGGDKNQATPFARDGGLGLILERSSNLILELTNVSGGNSLFQIDFQILELDI